MSLNTHIVNGWAIEAVRPAKLSASKASAERTVIVFAA